MYAPYANDLARLHREELISNAERAHMRRELSGPSVLERLTSKWRRPSVSADQSRAPRPAVAG